MLRFGGWPLEIVFFVPSDVGDCCLAYPHLVNIRQQTLQLVLAGLTQLLRSRHNPGHDLRERPATLTGIRAGGVHQAQCHGKADR
jgi:hypothetical protein